MYEANFEQPPKKQPALPPQPQELPPLLPAHIEETIRSIAPYFFCQGRKEPR
jgi:hypothetical protein